MNSRTAMRAAALAGAAFCAATAAQAAAKSTIVYTEAFDIGSAYLVDWNTAKQTAHVVMPVGAGDGTYTDDGTQRLVTLKTPIVYSYAAYDDCGESITQTVSVNQFVFRNVSGTAKKGAAQVVEIGTDTNVGGCEPGTTSFGTPTDAGDATTLLDMSVRPATTDLVPGAQLAGLSETPAPLVASDPLVAQVVTFGAGNITFNGTGDVVPMTTSNGWTVLDFGTFQRGYTRVSRNTTTGIECWLVALWQNGAPANVVDTLVVKPNAAAGFGSRSQAAHSWLEGLFVNTEPLPYFDLYTDHTGAFIYRALADGSIENSEPATWSFVGANLQTKRSYDLSQGWRQRTWIPLANYGTNHFVMESDDVYDGTGTFLSNAFPPRVNYYVDEGKAVKPAPTALGAMKSAAKRVAAPRAD